MNVAHQLGIKHAKYIASLHPGSDVEACDLHDLHFPFVTNDWFGNDDLKDDYWTAFWITLVGVSKRVLFLFHTCAHNNEQVLGKIHECSEHL